MPISNPTSRLEMMPSRVAVASAIANSAMQGDCRHRVLTDADPPSGAGEAGGQHISSRQPLPGDAVDFWRRALLSGERPGCGLPGGGHPLRPVTHGR